MRRYYALPAVGLALILFWLLLSSQGGELADLFRLLPRVRPYPLALAVLLQLLFFLDQAALYQALYAVLGYSLPLGRLYLITVASAAAGRLVPVGTPAGVAVFAAEASREGVSSWESVLNNALYYLFDYLAFFLFLAGGLLFLFTNARLASGQLIAAAVLFALILASVLGLYLAVSFQRTFCRWTERGLSWANSVGRKYRGRDLLDAGKVLAGLQQSLAQLQNLGKKRGRLAQVFAGSAMLQVIDLAVLYVLFRALRQPVSPGILVAGFGLATLFAHITFVPNGMGVYAASMAWVYASLGVPRPVATMVALLYRVITFWLPIPLGILAWHFFARGKARAVEP